MLEVNAQVVPGGGWFWMFHSWDKAGYNSAITELTCISSSHFFAFNKGISSWIHSCSLQAIRTMALELYCEEGTEDTTVEISQNVHPKLSSLDNFKSVFPSCPVLAQLHQNNFRHPEWLFCFGKKQLT